MKKPAGIYVVSGITVLVVGTMIYTSKDNSEQDTSLLGVFGPYFQSSNDSQQSENDYDNEESQEQIENDDNDVQESQEEQSEYNYDNEYPEMKSQAKNPAKNLVKILVNTKNNHHWKMNITRKHHHQKRITMNKIHRHPKMMNNARRSVERRSDDGILRRRPL